MGLVVLDTDVWSYLYKADSRAQFYADYLTGKVAAISFQTVAELQYWAIFRKWGDSRLNDLTATLRRFTILQSDDETATYWASIRAQRAGLGRPIAAQDAWVAACAIRHHAPLMTHNAADYQDIDALQLISMG